MTPDRWARITDLFDRAADLPPAERTDFLDRHAVTPGGAPDAALREEVERLLAADRADGYLGAAAGQRHAAAPQAPPPGAGPWRLVERVGRGGMGEVWRAERDGDYEQTAAVKLVRPGLGDDLVARFRAERQILAGLDHPAIARLLDGGAASDGRPYLATEFVDGRPITAWADAARLGVNERLRAFVEVCDAVAYAHARLVVHRDLKPSNVMVTEGGRVKLLDFGIAKLLDADDTQTQTGRQVLTPAYAAPEQTAGGAVTTATDVYGLGVLLYELLVGARPAPGGDATRPSDAVTVAATAGRVPPAPGADVPHDTGALRSTTADRLRRRLRGDLDRICLKALRADPERRYRGAAELGADVQRHLDGLPVKARPESVGYRVGKFVRRNRALVGAALAAALALVTGTGVALWQATEARAAQTVAETEAEKAQAVSDFLGGLFKAGSPMSSPTDTVSVREALQLGLDRIDGLDDEPAVQSYVLTAISTTYLELGGIDRADSLLTRSLDIARQGGALREEGEALDLLAIVRYFQGDVPAADSLGTLALAIKEEVHGPESLEVGAALGDLGVMRMVLGRPEEAERLQQRSLALKRLHLGEGDNRVTVTMDNLAAAKMALGKRDEALAMRRDVVRRFLDEHGEVHPSTAIGLGNLAESVMYAGDFAEAEALYARALAVAEQVFDATAPRIGSLHISLGTAKAWQERWADAEADFRRGLEIVEAGVGPNTPDAALALTQIAEAELRQSRLADARATLVRAADAADAAYPEGDVQRSGPIALGAEIALASGQPRRAERLARRALAVRRAAAPDRDRPIGEALSLLALALAEQGRTDDARRAADQADAALDANDPTLRPHRERVATVRRRIG